MERPIRPEDAATFISVSDPVQHSEGMGKYTSYRVDITRNNNNNQITSDDIFRNTSSSAVLRRYSDFLWLYERLHKERPGSIVPPLPEKQAVSRFSETFIEERRVNLERFLRRVAVHPELYDVSSFDAFLSADDIAFQAAKNAKGQAADAMVMSIAYPSSNPTLTVPPRKKDGIKKWFAETKASMAGDLVRSPDDNLFEEVERYIDGLEKQMKNVQQQASIMVKKDKEIANGLFEFGMAFNILGQSEADMLGEGLSRMGTTADGLSALSMDHAEKEIANFEAPLKDYIKIIHSVKLALQRRHEKRLTYTTCLSEVATKRANLARYRSTPGAEAKAYGAEMSLKRGEASSEAAKEEFITVSQRVLREMDRFKKENAESMKRTVSDFITMQIEYNKKMEQAWANLLPELEKIDLGTDSSSDNEPSITAPSMSTTGLEEHQEENPNQQEPMDQVSMSYRTEINLNENQMNVGDIIQYRDDNSGFPVHSHAG